jgi:hypothetical protein
LPSYLAYGVTTVANLNGSPEVLAMRAAVASGALVGPTIYTAGPIVNGDPPGNPTFVAVMDAEGGRRVADEQVDAGYDFIKVYSTLDVAPYDAVLAEARARNMAVLGHIPWCVGAERAVAGYQSDVAHAEEFLSTFFHRNPDDTSRLPELVKLVAASGETVTANMVAYSEYLRRPEEVVADPEMRFASPALFSERVPSNNRSVRADQAKFDEFLRKGHTLFQKLTKAFSDAGVPILLGTDTEGFGFPGKSALLELHELEDAGLTRYQAMVAATRAAGEYVAHRMHPRERFGVVAPGERADLLLVDGNPLASLDNLQHLRGVMARGRWLDARRLAELREEKARADGPLRSAVQEIDRLVGDGRFDEAASRLEALHRDHPESKIVAQGVLSSYARRAVRSAPAAAARLRALAIVLYPTSFAVHTDAARGYIAAGDRAAARRELEQATAMSPNDVVAHDMLERLNLLGTPPAFDPVGHFELTVAAREGNCWAEKALAVVVDLAKGKDGTYSGTLKIGGAKPEPLEKVDAAADRLWATSESAALRLVVDKDGKSVRGRYVEGFGANFPITGSKGRVRAAAIR